MKPLEHYEKDQASATQAWANGLMRRVRFHRDPDSEYVEIFIEEEVFPGDVLFQVGQSRVTVPIEALRSALDYIGLVTQEKVI